MNFVDLLFTQLGPGIGLNSYAPEFGEHEIG